MKKLVVATRNQGKLKELRLLLQGLVEEVVSIADFPDVPEVVEDGETFEVNALKKACAAVASTNLPAIADDSGLVVERLNGRPGVHSARFAGDNADDAANNELLLRELHGVPASGRSGYFQSVIALCLPDGRIATFSGRIDGLILDEPRGTDGFGYDPLFLVPSQEKTLAEIPAAEKNAISHRGKAFAALRSYLESLQG